MEQKQVCDGCGGKIAYPSEYAGTKTNCPHCKAEITLGSPSPAKAGNTDKQSVAPSHALNLKIAIAGIAGELWARIQRCSLKLKIAIAVVVIAGLALFAYPSKKMSGVFVGPIITLSPNYSFREQLDFRENGTVGVRFGAFNSSYHPGKYSVFGKTISIKFADKGDKESKALSMQFKIEGEDIVLTKDWNEKRNTATGHRWKRE